MTLQGRCAAAVRPLSVGLGLLLLAGGCAGLPEAPRIPAALIPHPLTPQQFANEKLYLETWSIIRGNYFDGHVAGQAWVEARNRHLPEVIAAKSTAEAYAAINAMIAELKDSHTAALTPAEAEGERTGTKARCGFQLVKIEDTWIVHDVLAGSPADKAGVKAGWIFLSEDGIAVGKKPLFDRRDGQTVCDLFLDDHEQPVSLLIAARVLPTFAKPQERILPGGIVYLRFDDFEVQSRRWFSERLKAHRDAPAVIVDLRSNPGGKLFSLDITTGELFPHSVPMGTFTHRSGWTETEDAREIFSAHYGGRLAVLIGPLSASSSEIFASTLKYYHRAVLVGQKSAGAVRGSIYYSLPDGGAVQVSVMDYHGPDGKELEGNGVEPDVPVMTSLADLRAGKDPVLQAALVRLRPETADRTP
jgi:carboxyl-terminal processing protease